MTKWASLAAELDALDKHRDWAQYPDKPKEARAALRPRPAFRDCSGCNYRKQVTNEYARQQTCAECPVEKAVGPLPLSCSERYWIAFTLASVPFEALDVDELSLDELSDLETLRVRKQRVF